jgi:hypothetical protein
MFGLFRRNDNKFIIDESSREMIDSSFNWLITTFGNDFIKVQKILVPHYSDFPIVYNGQADCVIKTLEIVTTHMNVLPEEIELDLYTEGQSDIHTGSGRVFLRQIKDEKYTSGLYWGKQDDGKYHIGLERKKIKDPEKMVAVLAHEIAHIKLLGEGRIEKNNESLTDLTTIIFGFGIFNANVSFKFYHDYDSWGYSKTGYLTQMEWGYALALYAYIRGERLPDWISYLTKNIRSDFKKSERFIDNNKEMYLRLKIN